MKPFLRILDKYILKELLLTFLAVLIVLLLITFGSEATKLLADAMQGKIPASVVLQVLLLKIPPALEIILPLVALISVMLAVGRLYQDQEMVVLNSCSIGPDYFKRIVFIFLIPIALITAWISLNVSPWSYQQERILISEAQTISPVAGLVPGKFNPLPNNQGVLYTKSISKNGQMESVWLKYHNKENDLILVAPVGRFEWIDNRVVLVLENGYSYRNLHANKEVSVQQFARFEGYLPELAPSKLRPKVFEKTTYELMQSKSLEELALLQWRLVTPFGIVVLGLLGLKMSRTGPREGRFAKLFIALVLYIVYNQLLVLGREGIANGGWPVWLGLWPVIVVFLWFAITDTHLNKPKSWLPLIKGAK
ncbi:LPS export ABC transporter permease LptF [Thiomicrorhabdus sp. Milos-T2]|uniref:LPS export ABC transporter permease LptF n=1 Tax=Thiomicrorhabdus sp. Milos-T2 TaxID=90814 RepID=UPI0021017734|nr:LPS export ABC transporter permease LptF [Thiomicrorhabdus sp. Milos-T2]